MKIEQAYDKIILDGSEVQRLLKEHIEKSTGCKVRGDIVIKTEEHNKVHASKCHYRVTTHAHTYLEPRE